MATIATTLGRHHWVICPAFVITILLTLASVCYCRLQLQNRSVSPYVIVSDGIGGCELRKISPNGADYEILFKYVNQQDHRLSIICVDSRAAITLDDGFRIGNTSTDAIIYRVYSKEINGEVEYVDLNIDGTWDFRILHSGGIAGKRVFERFYRGSWIDRDEMLLHWSDKKGQWEISEGQPRNEGQPEPGERGVELMGE